jgi:hypothetical protein
MRNSTWKFVIASVLASSGFVAFACGGGSSEGGGSNTPSATQTSTDSPPATTSAAGGTTATATATTPPAPTLPASFTAADDARKTADGAWTALVTGKETKCDAITTALTKFTKDNQAAYQTWNGEFGKLSDAQKGLVTSKPPTADASTATGGFKACMDKKDKKLTAAVAAADASMKSMPGAAGGGSASPAGSGSAAPAGSGSASKPPKKP